MENIEKWTDWEAPQNVLPNSSTQNLEVKDQLLINETKWLNDGVPYADAGLLGVPDTSFSPTGARIYPDGTIRGKSSYGIYNKFPCGVLKMYGKTVISFTSTAEAAVIIYYPTTIVGEVASPNIKSGTTQGAVNGKRVCPVYHIGGNYLGIDIYYRTIDESVVTGSAFTTWTFIGEWK